MGKNKFLSDAKRVHECLWRDFNFHPYFHSVPYFIVLHHVLVRNAKIGSKLRFASTNCMGQTGFGRSDVSHIHIKQQITHTVCNKGDEKCICLIWNLCLVVLQSMSEVRFHNFFVFFIRVRCCSPYFFILPHVLVRNANPESKLRFASVNCKALTDLGRGHVCHCLLSHKSTTRHIWQRDDMLEMPTLGAIDWV